MMSKFVNDWIEIGITSKVRRGNASIPTLTDENGDNQTPKPLFSSFSSDAQLEPKFLPEYLTAFENKYRHADSINLDKYFSENVDCESPKEDIEKGERIIIEYDRKNIFLSRVMFNLFDMPDSSVPKGSPEYSNVLEKNLLYQNALERHKQFPENFIEQSIQTDFIDAVDKEIETSAMACESKTCMINNYLFNEHYNRHEMKIKPPPKTFREFFDDKTKFYNYKEFLSKLTCHTDIFSRVQDALYITEKTLDYNTYENSILEFNGCNKDLCSSILESLSESKEPEDIQNEHSSDEIGVKHHLSFYLEKLNKDYQVTCLECSSFNPNIFVAGYGVPKKIEMKHEHRGMVLSWNIHKCGYPEKIYNTEEIVTSLEFSKSEPYLVAVGMRYGLIATFYLQHSENCASSTNHFSKVKPIGSTQNIRWYKKKFGMGKEIPMLLSVSTDGAICSWTCGRQIDGNLHRYIKRGNIENTADASKRLVVAVNAAGICMQFKPGTNKLFLIGTIEGEVLLADINDPDTYKHVYKCHNGPLYDLQWSPLLSDVFMTTGIDRYIHIWQIGRKKPPKSLTTEENVLKVAWSCVKSTLFAALCKTKILFFDLAIDLHKEIAEYRNENDAFFTCLNFCPKNNWVLVGQSDGKIQLLELCNIPDLVTNQEDALRRTFLSHN